MTFDNKPAADDKLVPESVWAELVRMARAAAPPPFDPNVLADLRKDPYLKPRVDALRDQARKEFLAAIDQTVAAMPKDAMKASTVQLNSAPMSGRRLMIDSRKGELADKSRRELVEAFAMEAVLNLGNPDWDPTRPETSRETSTPFLALLR